MHDSNLPGRVYDDNSRPVSTLCTCAPEIHSFELVHVGLSSVQHLCLKVKLLFTDCDGSVERIMYQTGAEGIPLGLNVSNSSRRNMC